MGRFAFLLHPTTADHLRRKFPPLRPLSDRWVENLFRPVPPWTGARITGIASPTGATAEGRFIILPWTPRMLLETPWEVTLARLIRAGHLAERSGAQLLGLGAYTKIAGDRGVTLNDRLRIPVTTGNSYTAATAVEGALLGLDRMGKDRARAVVAVIGATGAVGAACARVLAPDIGGLRLSARDPSRLDSLREALVGEVDATCHTSVREAVRDADAVICVSSAIEGILDPGDLAPGAVVCDVARPRNVSAALHGARDDVLVIDGGVIAVPGDHMAFGMDFGFPPRTAEACIAETIILALEGRWEPFTLGRDIDVARVREVADLGRKHGFRLTGFRRFERAIDDAEISRIRQRAEDQLRQRRGPRNPATA